MRTQHARSSRDDTRRRILEAAGRIFAGQGFDAATIKQITDAAQFSVWPCPTSENGPSRLFRDLVLKKNCAYSSAVFFRPFWERTTQGGIARWLSKRSCRHRTPCLNWLTNILPLSPGIWRTSCANSVHMSLKQNRSDWLRRASWRSAFIGLYFRAFCPMFGLDIQCPRPEPNGLRTLSMNCHYKRWRCWKSRPDQESLGAKASPLRCYVICLVPHNQG